MKLNGHKYFLNMLITKEQKASWLNAYIKEKHTQEECIGFIDGMDKVLEVINEQMVKDRKQLDELLKELKK